MQSPALLQRDRRDEAALDARAFLTLEATEYYRFVRRALLVTNALALEAALFAAAYVASGSALPSLNYLALALLSPILWLPVHIAYRVHCADQLTSPDRMRRVIAAASVGTALVLLASVLLGTAFSRGWLLVLWGSTIALELGSDAFWAWRVRVGQATGRLAQRTLIVGTNNEAEGLAEKLRRPGSGFRPLGYVGTAGVGAVTGSLTMVGSVRDIDDIIPRLAAECVFVASSSISPEEMEFVTEAARRHRIEVRVSALSQTLASRLGIHRVGNDVVLSLQPLGLSRFQQFLKRSFDVACSALALILASPILLAISAAIAVTSRGPVLFTQQRITDGGRPFTMYKFRTMVHDADRILTERALDPTTPFFKLQDDPRLTRLGRFLRRYSLDELPQFLNVLKGDMSIVGPRPLPAEQVAANLEALRSRHEVRAGLTGWWQINGRSNHSSDEAVRQDEFYVQNWSLGLDLIILFRTIPAVLTRRGAY